MSFVAYFPRQETKVLVSVGCLSLFYRVWRFKEFGDSFLRRGNVFCLAQLEWE